MLISKENWFVYIIRCKEGELYTGITKDVSRRFQEHTAQGSLCAKYLRGKAPLQLVYCKEVNERTTALKLEKQIKSLKKIEKEKLIQAVLLKPNLF